LRDPVDVASGPNGNNYQDGMVEHDMHVGQLLKLLDDLGIANNTIVLYSRAAIGPI
jgi:arylsulfatase A-like enzyme